MAKEGYFSFKMTDEDKEHIKVIASAMGVDTSEWGKVAEVIRFTLRLVALGFVTIPNDE
jgi:hypothetical protein